MAPPTYSIPDTNLALLEAALILFRNEPEDLIWSDFVTWVALEQRLLLPPEELRRQWPERLPPPRNGPTHLTNIAAEDFHLLTLLCSIASKIQPLAREDRTAFADALHGLPAALHTTHLNRRRFAKRYLQPFFKQHPELLTPAQKKTLRHWGRLRLPIARMLIWSSIFAVLVYVALPVFTTTTAHSPRISPEGLARLEKRFTEQGDVSAARWIATHYYFQRDYDKARLWYTKAIELGDEKSVEDLKRLDEVLSKRKQSGTQ